jgi:hypothetical protein
MQDVMNFGDQVGWIGILPVGTVRPPLAARPKPINLPSVSRLRINMEHIVSGHMAGGSRVSPNKTLFPSSWDACQVENAIKAAYRYGKKVQTRGPRVRIQGVYDNINIEMWVNTTDNVLEAAYPLPR